MPHREEVYNVELARVLGLRGLAVAPEVIRRRPGKGIALPDGIVVYRGLRVVIEGRFEDAANAEDGVTGLAQQRVEDGIAHVSIAVIYPAELRRDFTDLDELDEALQASKLKVRTISETGPGDWHQGTVETIGALLRRIHEELVREDVVAKAVTILEDAIEAASANMSGVATVPLQLAELLSIGEPEDAADPADSRLQAATRIASLTLLNALIFLEELRAHNTKVAALGDLPTRGLKRELKKRWHFILSEIDYYPIFNVAVEALGALPAQLDSTLALLADAAQEIVSLRAALRHDLMGRVYHRLLVAAKYLGTYYTSIPAAIILAKTALRAGEWELDWSDPEQIARLKIADLASGTGTLLSAVIQAALDMHVRACVDEAKKSKPNELHRALVEGCIWGYDVIASASHLTATTLALLAPAVSFDNMHLYTLELGVGEDGARLGSIDFLGPLAGGSATHEGGYSIGIQADLFGRDSKAAERIRGGAPSGASNVAELPPLDVCIMNPPFVRSVGANRLFGSLPEAEREALREALAKVLKTPGVRAQSTAGLGAVFVAVADRVVKPGGVIALVLPRAVLTGVAWRETRELFASNYDVAAVFVSDDPEHWSFSENTDIGECLIVARKRAGGSRGAKTLWIHLWNNPDTIADSLAFIHFLEEVCNLGGVPDLLGATGVCRLEDEDCIWGEAYYVGSDLMQTEQWTPQAFAQTEVSRVATELASTGDLRVRSDAAAVRIPLQMLGQVADVGPDRRDVTDAFKLSRTRTQYPAFWGHETDAVRSIQQSATAYLVPRTVPAKNRKRVVPVSRVWPGGAGLLVAERLRLNKTRTVAVRLAKPSLGNVWWPVRIKKGIGVSTPDAEKILSLWLNSSLGLLLMLQRREDTEGSWVALKKPQLADLPVIDIAKLTPVQRRKLLEAYDEFAAADLLPIGELATDPVRTGIDSVFAEVLDLPDIAQLRELVAEEPVLSGSPLGRKPSHIPEQVT